jgi:hypothetical protein
MPMVCKSNIGLLTIGVPFLKRTVQDGPKSRPTAPWTHRWGGTADFGIADGGQRKIGAT